MKYLIFFLVPVLFFSCKKDVIEEAEVAEFTDVKEVYAGIVDNTFNDYTFQPNFGVTVNWDAQNLYGMGYDSIDLDLNGSFDLFVTINLLNPDSVHLLNGALPIPFPGCDLSSSNEFQLAFYTESFPIGMGQTSTISFIDRLDFEERIDLIADWRNEGSLWQENPGWVGAPPYGDWYSSSNPNFIGIKRGSDKYGWIEVDAADRYNPKFTRYAICQ